jgi:methionine-gamma-lyase
MNIKSKNIETLAIHAGEESDQHQSLNPPIYMISTFTFKDIEHTDDIIINDIASALIK